MIRLAETDTIFLVMKTHLVILFLLLTTSIEVWAQWNEVVSFDEGVVAHLNANDQYIFAATKGGVFRSDNPEEGWQKISEGDEAKEYNRIEVYDDLILSMILLHRGENNGDMGIEPVNNSANFPHDVRRIAMKGDTLIARNYLGIGAIMSQDGGLSWNAFDFPYNDARWWDADDEYFYQVSASFLWRTTDLEYFEPIGEELGFGNEWQRLHVSPTGNLYLTCPGGIFKSPDQGVSWEEVEVPSIFGNEFWVFDWSFSGDSIAVQVSSPVSGILWSDDDGLSWTFIEIPPPYNPESVSFFNDELFIAPEFRGVQKMEIIDGMAFLTPVGSGITVPGVKTISRTGDRFYVYREKEGMYETEEQFTEIAPVSGLPEYDWTNEPADIIKYSNGGTLIQLGEEELEIYFNLHDNYDWQQFEGIPSFLGDLVAFQYKNDTILLKGSIDVHVTSDLGSSWNGLWDILAYGSNNIALYNNGRYFFQSVSNGLGYSEELGGANIYTGFTLDTGTGLEGVHTMHARNNNLLFIATDSRAISHDNGDTWEVMANPVSFRSAQARDSIVVAAGRGHDVYVSTDFGYSFQPVSSTDGLPIYSLYDQILFDDHFIYLMVERGNIYHASAVELGINNFTNITENKSSHLNLYPNPTREYVNLDKPFQRVARIHVYNMSGEIISEFLLKVGETKINLNNLTPGLYLLQIHTADGEVFHSKVLLTE